MEILFITRELLKNIGGGEINDLNLSQELENLGADIKFLSRRPVFKNAPQRIDELKDRDCYSVRSPYLYGISNLLPLPAAKFIRHIDGVLFASAARDSVRKLNPDIIHATDRPTITSLKKKLRTPLVYNIRGNVNPIYFKYLDRADAFIAWGSASTKVVENFPTKPSLHLTPGVNTELFSPGRNESLRYELGLNGYTVLMFVGRLMQVKQIDMLMKVFSKLSDQREDLALLIVGDGPLDEQLRKQADKIGAGKKIVFTGRISQDLLPNYYRCADLFVLPSKNENHPIVLLEALSTGLPVVSSRVGDVPNMVKHGQNGYLFKAGDIEDLELQIENALTMLNNDDTRESNRNSILEKHSWLTRAKSVYEFYEKLI